MGAKTPAASSSFSGSLKELETHLIIAQKVRALSEPEFQSLLPQCDEIGKMIRALIRSLQEKA
jgi:four helix bundle protein